MEKVSTEAEQSARVPENMENIQQICQAVKEVKTFTELQNLVERIDLAPVECQEMGLKAEDLDVDAVSVPLVPQEFTNLTPVAIYGDGNCLPRCASLFAFHTQTKHAEMRVRIVIELVKNEKHYLSADLDIGGTKNSATTFASFSEFFRGQKLSPRSIQNLYRREVLTLIKDGTYMGAWQMASLATILGRVVNSVYPNYAAETVRKDLHRIFRPLGPQAIDACEPIHILWTNTQGVELKPRDWRPNHFVLLLPQ